MKKGTFSSFIIYGLIIVSWVALIAGGVYLSQMSQEGHENADEMPTKGRVLRLLVWGDLFDKNFLRKFEAATGATLQISSYDTNEELIVKLKISEGRGYDIIAPSDYAVQILRDEELLRPLDHTKMPFLSTINPLLLGQHYDPNNGFSVPYEWEVYGIAYDKEFFAKRPLSLQPSWSMFFSDPHGAFRVIVSDDALETIRLAAHFLFGKVDELTEEQIDAVEALLKDQHRWVEAYTRTNLDYYLVAGYSPVAFASSAYVARRRQLADKLGFFVPQEGGLITIENLAVPIHAENEDLIYAFLNFVMSPESMTHHFDKLTYFPSTLNVEEPTYITPEIRSLRTMSAEEFKKLIFVKQIMPEERMNHLWVAIK
jgi:spermidine/putrescine transport system substrate-binding protein